MKEITKKLQTSDAGQKIMFGINKKGFEKVVKYLHLVRHHTGVLELLNCFNVKVPYKVVCNGTENFCKSLIKDPEKNQTRIVFQH